MRGPLLQCSYMPGDTFTIAAWLALRPEERVVLLQDTSLADDKSGFILPLYANTGVDKQVSVVDLKALYAGKLSASPCKEIYRLWSSDKLPNSRGEIAAYKSSPPDAKKDEVIRAALTAVYDRFNRWPRAVTAVTGWVANEVGGDVDRRLTTLLQRWGVSLQVDARMKAFDEFLSAKAMSALKANTLVLWSRQSGKRGGAHLELDSSYLGLAQLIEEFQYQGGGEDTSLILVGDEKVSTRTGKLKLEELAKEFGVHYLGEFWKSKEWTSRLDDNRINQMAFWVYLNSKKSKLHHLGMRSGALELMSLLKMPAIYLEPKGSKSGSRMTAFAEKGIEYVRLHIEHSPGLTAQWGQDYEGGAYGAKVPVAVHSNWEREKGDKAWALKQGDLKAKDLEIDRKKEAMNKAFDEGRKKQGFALQREFYKLLEEKKAIRGADYTDDAVAELKKVDPKGGPERTRGFDPQDVEDVMRVVLSRIK